MDGERPSSSLVAKDFATNGRWLRRGAGFDAGIPFTELDRYGSKRCLKETFVSACDAKCEFQEWCARKRITSCGHPGQVVVNADTDENGWQYAFVGASAYERMVRAVS